MGIDRVDQADAYAKKLLTSALPRLTALDKFNMLRSVSITSAGMRAYGEGTMSKEQLEAKVLKHYLEVIVLDVARHQKGLAENLTVDMMSQRSLKLKRITKRIQQALDRKSKKAKLKNEVPPDEGLYSGIEGNDLNAAIRAESNNTFNPIWVKALNSILSKKYLVLLTSSFFIIECEVHLCSHTSRIQKEKLRLASRERCPRITFLFISFRG